MFRFSFSWIGTKPRALQIAHRTGLGMRLAECEGDLEAVLLDALQFQVYEPSSPGRPASGTEPAWLLERYPEATWYE